MSVFMSTITTYGDKTAIRRLGDVVNVTELDDDTIDDLITSNGARIAAITNYSEWVSTDLQWFNILEAGNLLTASSVIKRVFSDDAHLVKAKNYEDEAMRRLTEVNANPGITDSPTLRVIVSDYATRGLFRQENPDSEVVQHYLSDY
jgi:hypothetical protein